MSPLSFNPQAIGFDLTNALSLAEASNLAYEKKDVIKKKVEEEWKMSTFKFFGTERGGTQAFLAADEKKIIVSFRGTEPNRIKDWMTDLNLFMERGPVGRVHGGFADGLAAVWKDMKGEIAALTDDGADLREKIAEMKAIKESGQKKIVRIKKQKAPRTLWFTGHSLGAALATLAVADLKLRKDDQPVNGLYTFGQPRTGDTEFANAFNTAFGSQTFRFVNNNDLVTRIPPRSLGFSHLGELRYFDVNGRLHEDMKWWYRFMDRVKGRLEDFVEILTLDLPFDGVEDHNMEKGYIPLIESWWKKKQPKKAAA